MKPVSAVSAVSTVTTVSTMSTESSVSTESAVSAEITAIGTATVNAFWYRYDNCLRYTNGYWMGNVNGERMGYW